jgi:hypothetical protein
MWRAKVYPIVVCKFLLVLVDLHNILFTIWTQLRNADLSKYQPWTSIHVTDWTASPTQLNYTNSIWNQILGSKHLFQFFIFFEHCATGTAHTVNAQPYSYSSNPAQFHDTFRVSADRCDFTIGVNLQAVQTSTPGTPECLNHILMENVTANTCQPMGCTWTAVSQPTATLSVL